MELARYTRPGLDETGQLCYLPGRGGEEISMAPLAEGLACTSDQGHVLSSDLACLPDLAGSLVDQE